MCIAIGTTVKEEIEVLNQKKAPGLKLIAARMLQELPKEGLVDLMYTGCPKTYITNFSWLFPTPN